ncbi:MAG: PH domain-containing protein [Planctomycetes bacterium]|nr:PH domain-containing protein [Planctomycetota bacterium]
MSEQEIRWYPSKVDTWILALLLFVPAVQVVVIVTSAIAQAWPATAIGLLAFLFFACLYALCVWPMRYGIGDEFLIVRFGICRSRVRIENIREVYRTSNPLSSPALSLDRLWIQHGPRWYQAVMISPRDQETFIADLAARVPLERAGRGWRSRKNHQPETSEATKGS